MGSTEPALMLASPNKLKFAVFGINVEGGNSITSVPETCKVDWATTTRIAKASDEAGFEAIIPVARWKGYGGETNFNQRSYESIVWSAGVAGMTTSIQPFATVHVPTIHPVRAAKEMVTADHIANGRFGLNIVAGWNHAEIEMFGSKQREHDERYAVADEWITLIKRLWDENEEFDFHGKYFDVPAAISDPKPIRRPYPLIMSAGASPAGRAFAAKHADVNFVNIPTFDSTSRSLVDQIKSEAWEKHGREILVMGSGHIVCASTEEEAKRYFHHYVYERGDWDAARNYMRRLAGQSHGYTDPQSEPFGEALVAGAAATMLVGTPEQVVDGLAKLSEAGLDGVVLSWVDYEAGIQQYVDEILPLLKSAGLRTS